jgi:cytochrome c oxidase subunit 2
MARSAHIVATLASVAIGDARGAEVPLSYLTSAGEHARRILPLTWGVLGISAVVVAVIIVLTLLGVWRRTDRSPQALAATPHKRDGSRWLYIGVGVSSVVLVVSLVWTVRVLASANDRNTKGTLTIEVTGQQWWWKVRYLNDDASKILTTANEIHIPTGQSVRVRLVAADVIHSFWVPALSGKTDLIPGQTNMTWIEADKPGRYRGQCSEYCGAQHAHMGFEVVAQSPADFQRWMEDQLAAAPSPASESALRGEQTFEFRCGACHTVRGTFAGGTTGPDLTHLLSRATIAAATLPNREVTRAAWIADPQGPKPGNHMPVLQLSSTDLQDVDAFLSTLK